MRFNPVEPDLLASTASDRSLTLYDLRSSTPIRKLIMQVLSLLPGACLPARLELGRPAVALHLRQQRTGLLYWGLPARIHARLMRVIDLQTRSNSVAWNPMEAFNLTLANEDCSLYTYDIRKLKSAACVHKVMHSRGPPHLAAYPASCRPAADIRAPLLTDGAATRRTLCLL